MYEDIFHLSADLRAPCECVFDYGFGLGCRAAQRSIYPQIQTCLTMASHSLPFSVLTLSSLPLFPPVPVPMANFELRPESGEFKFVDTKTSTRIASSPKLCNGPGIDSPLTA